MGKYLITIGQNLYDVAMHLYGSIEGIIDLLINNPNLSMDDKLIAGDELMYTDDYTINEDIVAYNTAHTILPASGERNVYYKHPSFPKIVEIQLDNKKTSASFAYIGVGEIEIDWGDNTPLEKLFLKNESASTLHYFDYKISSKRRIRIYAHDVKFKELNFSTLHASSILCSRPLSVEKFILSQTKINISSLSLLKDVYYIDLTGLETSDLSPLLKQKQLMLLDLQKIAVSQTVLDSFLISIVQHYHERRSCNVLLTMKPSGNYQEPAKDDNNKYVLTSGMEAIWVITHEEAWNEGGYWQFQINDTIYTTEP